MFSTLPVHTFHSKQPTQFYSPHVPSPLSSSPLRRSPSSSPPKIFALQERDANIMTDFSSSPLASKSKDLKTTPSRTMEGGALISPPQTSSSRFSKRQTKPNPLLGRDNGDEGRATRRKLFLRRVREESEEKRWRNRMSGENGWGEEELLRSIWVGEESRLEEGRRREAMRLGLGLDEVEEDEMDEAVGNEVSLDEEAELEALLIQEERLQQLQDVPDDVLVCHLPSRKTEERPETETLYGSDDEEYDHIFMDFVESESRTATQQPLPGYVQDQDMMDVS